MASGSGRSAIDQAFDPRRIEVADGDDGHEIGAIPVRVELLQTVVLEVPDDLGRSDRHARGIPRVLEQDRKLRVQDPRVGAETHPPLLQDDAALLVDLVRVEGHRVRPVLEDQQRPVDDARIVGGNLQLVDRLVEARIGVDVRSEAHPGRLEKRDDFLLREVTRAVEAHVLDEVREPALIVLFENRSCVDDEPELGPGLRILLART